MHTRKTSLSTPNRATPLAATRCVVVIAILLCPHLVYAQKTLGEVLDAGGLLMSLEQFKQEIAQHVVTGPSPTGRTVEMMYGSKGGIDGISSNPLGFLGTSPDSPFTGQWSAGDRSSVCTTMQVRGTNQTMNVTLPRRCQYWFKVGDQYFLSDSDTDRQARVFARTIKP
jgi:Ni/Co efflux regulator RcnB